MTHDDHREATSVTEQSSPYTSPPSSRPGYSETSPPARRLDGWTRLHIVEEAELFATEIRDRPRQR